MIRGSTEFVVFTLVDRDGEDLSADVVQLALVDERTTPDDDTDWLACTFLATFVDPVTNKTGSKWRTTNPVLFDVAGFPNTSYPAYARVTDAPETPFARVGTVPISS